MTKEKYDILLGYQKYPVERHFHIEKSTGGIHSSENYIKETKKRLGKFGSKIIEKMINEFFGELSKWEDLPMFLKI